jgi:two-component sensor histidine kinase
MQLSKSKKFLDEYTLFNSKISRINDQKIKSEMEILVKQLVREVQSIDMAHEELVGGGKMQAGSNDSKGNLISIRKKIVSKLEEYEKSGIIS